MALNLKEFIQVRIEDSWSVISEDEATNNTLTVTIIRMPDEKTLIVSVADGFIKKSPNDSIDDDVIHLQPIRIIDTKNSELRKQLQDHLQSIVNSY